MRQSSLAGLFYEPLLQVYEQDPAKTKKSYSWAMRYTDHKYFFKGDAAAGAKPGVKRSGGGGNEEGATPVGPGCRQHSH